MLGLCFFFIGTTFNVQTIAMCLLQENGKAIKRSKLFLFFTGFNAGVKLNQAHNQGGGKPGNWSSLRNFYTSIYVSEKKVMLIHVSCENPLNKLLTTCILSWSPFFLHSSVYSQQLCVERSLVWAQRMLISIYSRANWPTTVFLTFQLLRMPHKYWVL